MGIKTLIGAILKSVTAPAGVVAGTGRVIGKKSRDEYKYVEGERLMIINAELLGGKIERAICYDSIRRWEPPFDHEPISEEKRQEILRNFCSYLESQHISYKVWKDPD
jgi:hypothetical protein